MIVPLSNIIYNESPLDAPILSRNLKNHNKRKKMARRYSDWKKQYLKGIYSSDTLAVYSVGAENHNLALACQQ
jgi:hypothetical protein